MKGNARADELPYEVRTPSVVLLFFYWFGVLTMYSECEQKDLGICLWLCVLQHDDLE
jgi:hypothetical protein